MPKRVLVAYETNAGSTEEVARTIGDTLGSNEVEVDVLRVAEVGDMAAYDAVAIGAPMILGWHRRAVKFIRRHRDALSRVPVAYFMTALSLTNSEAPSLQQIDTYLDPALLKEPKKPQQLSFKERHNCLEAYLKPVLKKAPQVKPVRIALFAGKLDYRKLKFAQMVFVMLLFAEKPRDYRNWENIRGWAAELRTKLLGAK